MRMVSKRKVTQNQEANAAQKHHASRDALRKALDHLERHPGDTAVLRSTSLALLDLAQLDEARALIERAIVIEPANDELKSAQRRILDAFLWRMMEKGEATWSGGKPKGGKRPVGLTPGPSISDYIVEERQRLRGA